MLIAHAKTVDHAKMVSTVTRVTAQLGTVGIIVRIVSSNYFVMINKKYQTNNSLLIVFVSIRQSIHISRVFSSFLSFIASSHWFDSSFVKFARVLIHLSIAFNLLFRQTSTTALIIHVKTVDHAKMVSTVTLVTAQLGTVGSTVRIVSSHFPFFFCLAASVPKKCLVKIILKVVSLAINLSIQASIVLSHHHFFLPSAHRFFVLFFILSDVLSFFAFSFTHSFFSH